MKRRNLVLSALLAVVITTSAVLPGCNYINMGKNAQVSDKSQEDEISSENNTENVIKKKAPDVSEDETSEVSVEVSEAVSVEESKENEEQIRFEEEVSAADQRWKTMVDEYDILREYKEINYPESYFKIFDENNDGHLEMFIGCTTYWDTYGAWDGTSHPNMLCSLNGTNVETKDLISPDAVRGSSYYLAVMPEKDEGKVIGVDRYLFVRRYGDMYERYISFDSFTGSVLVSEKGYDISKDNINPEIANFRYSIIDGESRNVSFEELESDLKQNYDMLASNDGFSSNSDNGDNSLVDMDGYFDDYLLYESDTRIINRADLESMLRRNKCDDDHSKKLYLELARNEMAAKYGYKFKTTELKDYFDNLDWYAKLTQDNYTSYASQNNGNTPLGEIEKANNDIILEYETELGLDDIKLQ